MNYYPIKFQDKILRNVEIIKKNVNRLVFLDTLYYILLFLKHQETPDKENQDPDPSWQFYSKKARWTNIYGGIPAPGVRN